MSDCLENQEQNALWNEVEHLLHRARPCARRAWSPAGAWPKRLFGLGKSYRWPRLTHGLETLGESTEAVRARLLASNNQHLQVLPVIVTSKTRMDVRADLEQAEKLGILVVTKADLAEGVSRTVVREDPDKIYDDARELIRAATAKYEQQPNLPGVP